MLHHDLVPRAAERNQAFFHERALAQKERCPREQLLITNAPVRMGSGDHAEIHAVEGHDLRNSYSRGKLEIDPPLLPKMRMQHLRLALPVNRGLNAQTGTHAKLSEDAVAPA